MRYLSAILVFLVVFGIMFFLFNGGITKIQGFVDKKEVKKNTITTSQLMDKLAEKSFGIDPFWLKRYNITVRSLEDLQVDADNDGLTLEQEYLYLTNPFNADTDGDGYKDGEEIANGNSPIGIGKLDTTQIAQFKETKKEVLNVKVKEENRNAEDFDNDGLSNDLENAYGTDLNKADTDGDGYDDFSEIKNGYDPTVLGDARPDVEIQIEKINVNAPVILSKDVSESVLQKDLERGVIHYPKTAMPGQRGNVYIAGHSSYYSWSAGNYNYIFKNLNNLAVGDKIILKVTYKNGKSLEFVYQVSEKLEVNADDYRIFEETQSQVLTLTTCWPIGTDKRRIMVKAHLIQ